MILGTKIQDLWVAAAIAAAIAGVVTTLMVPLVTTLARAARALDYPGGRKFHADAIPRLGGVAIAFGLLFGAGGMGLVKWSEWGARVGKNDLAVLILATALIFSVGLVDDIIGVSAFRKFLVQLVAALMIVGLDWSFSVLALPGLREVNLDMFGKVVTVLWIVGVTNAVNLVDGLDGLAGGVVAIISGSLLVYAVGQQNLFTVILMAAIVGACLGFLRHNWTPAQIFMGDAGSLTLGFLLATMSVHSSLKASAAIAILVPILALGVPVIDTLLVMLVRFLERPKSRIAERFLRMFSADRNHLHHLLQRAGASRTTVVRTIYVLVLASCLAALAVGTTKNCALGVSLIVVELGAIVLIRTLGLARRVRTISEEQRGEIRDELLPRLKAESGEHSIR